MNEKVGIKEKNIRKMTGTQRALKPGPRHQIMCILLLQKSSFIEFSCTPMSVAKVKPARNSRCLKFTPLMFLGDILGTGMILVDSL